MAAKTTRWMSGSHKKHQGSPAEYPAASDQLLKGLFWRLTVEEPSRFVCATLFGEAPHGVATTSGCSKSPLGFTQVAMLPSPLQSFANSGRWPCTPFVSCRQNDSATAGSHSCYQLRSLRRASRSSRESGGGLLYCEGADLPETELKWTGQCDADTASALPRFTRQTEAVTASPERPDPQNQQGPHIFEGRSTKVRNWIPKHLRNK